MKQLLSAQAYQELSQHGYFKPGIKLEQSYITQAREVFASYTTKDSNFGYYYSNVISNYAKPKNLRHFWGNFLNRHFPALEARKEQFRRYSKCVFDTSSFMPIFIQACLDRGLTDSFADKNFLLSHDVLFESDRQDSTFGFHYDPFSWDFFLQSGDDLTLYMPLQDLNEESGGRLWVEKFSQDQDKFATRNSDVADFFATCARYAELNQYGQVSRDACKKSKHADRIADAYGKLLMSRHRKPPKQADEMSVITAQAGEVFVFNNKNFHTVEPWKLHSKRQNFSTRLLPLYDFGAQPPETFLDNRQCSRYVLDVNQGCIQAFDPKHAPRSVYYPWR